MPRVVRRVMSTPERVNKPMDKSKWKIGVFLVALTAFFSVIAVAVGSAEAARGGGGKPSGGGASIRLNEADPHLGDWVTFTTSGGSQIHLLCSQGIGNYVYNTVQPVGTAFQLGANSEWQSGSATCYADLYSSNNRKLASTSFFSLGAR